MSKLSVRINSDAFSQKRDMIAKFWEDLATFAAERSSELYSDSPDDIVEDAMDIAKHMCVISDDAHAAINGRYDVEDDEVSELEDESEDDEAAEMLRVELEEKALTDLKNRENERAKSEAQWDKDPIVHSKNMKNTLIMTPEVIERDRAAALVRERQKAKDNRWD